MVQRLRNYCFTVFPEECDFEELFNIYTSTTYSYMIMGNETCPETGRFHGQGYMEFPKAIRISQLKKEFPTIHFEECKGTQEQNIKYCTKDGDYLEIGEPKRPGQRNDLLHIKHMIDSGSTLEDVRNEHYGDFIRYNFQKDFDVIKKFNYGECEVMIYRGDDPYSWKGCYKSETFIGSDEYISQYNGQEAIIFEDGGHYRDIGRFARNIPVTVKYGFQNREILPRYIIYCCKKFPKDSPFYDFVTEVSSPSSLSSDHYQENGTEVSGVILKDSEISFTPDSEEFTEKDFLDEETYD